MTAIHETTTAGLARDALARSGEITELRLRLLLAAERQRWNLVNPAVAVVIDAIESLIDAGGKRLRPALCYWAYIGSGGAPGAPMLADVCAALELVHVFGLVHDDIVDGAEHRRGVPTVHRRLAHDFPVPGDGQHARQVGTSLGILAGDLALTFGDRLLDRVPPDVRGLVGELKTEMCAGQILDVVMAAQETWDLDQAIQVALYKSAKYSVERPLQIGACLATGSAVLPPELSEFGIALGLAFQLVDDLLDVFGDPDRTGKPRGGDLAEGKITVLACLARDTLPDASVWERFGAGPVTDADVEAYQDLLGVSQARKVVEDVAADLTRLALAKLEVLDLLPEAKEHLRALVGLISDREA
jgi:geranylgeranyl diphosphate synthase, type I